MTGRSNRIENVFIVTIDALRARSLGCYGYKYDISPNIDEFATDSATFENAYTCANSTYPSVTSIHSGTHPTASVLNHGGRVTSEEKRRAEALRTLPMDLSDRGGYYTAWVGGVFGLWHKRGFDRFPPLRPSHDKRVLFTDGEARSDIRSHLDSIHPRLGNIVGDSYYQFEQAVGRVKELARKSGSDDDEDEIDTLLQLFDDTDDRFYGYLHLNETHTPYDADRELIERYLDEHNYSTEPIEKITDPDPPECSATANAPYTDDWFEKRDKAVGTARWKARYDACVTEADQKFGRLIDGLRQRGALDRSLIVLLSDHGESTDENGIYFAHDGLYEPVVRIPFIVRAPATERTRRGEFVQPMDIVPTLADLWEIDNNRSYHGESFTPLIGYDGDWPQRESVLFEMASCQRRRGVIKGNHKCVFAVEGDFADRHDDRVTCRKCGHPHWSEVELYDLESDPGETTNIADSSPDVVEDLKSEAARLKAEFVHPGDFENTADVEYEEEGEVAERLKHLGYAE